MLYTLQAFTASEKRPCITNIIFESHGQETEQSSPVIYNVESAGTESMKNGTLYYRRQT